MVVLVVRDARDERIAELEAELRARDERIVVLEQRVATLAKQVADLSEKLGRNPRNSHLPPSSDSPSERGERRDKDKPKKGQRKRGAQQGHKGSHRELLPPEKVNEFVDLYPPECESCWKPLPEVADPLARRHQQTEIPPVQPQSPFGPRLMAIMALLTGVYYLSRRSAVGLLSDVLGVRVSLGALSAVEARVSAAVAPAVAEVWEQVGQAKVKHTDGTSWYQAGLSMALWTIATVAATAFKIVPNSAKDTLRPLYGALAGILVSDRAKALSFWAMERRQICWAHLLRKFVSFAERGGPAGAFGRLWLDYTGLRFEYWHAYKDARLSREQWLA